MRPASAPASLLAAVCLLAAAGSVLACSGCRSAHGAADASGLEDGAGPTTAGNEEAGDGAEEAKAAATPRVVLVRLLDPSPELRQSVDRVAADIGRWASGVRLEVVAAAAGGALNGARTKGHGTNGAGTEGGRAENAGSAATSAGLDGAPPALEIEAGLLPLRDGARRLVRDLPVALSGGALGLAGERYPSPDAALALHLPGDGAPPRWLVVGRDARGVARLVAERTFLAAGYTMDGWQDDTDYMLRQAGWQRRSGRWLRDGDGRWAANDERNDFADQERWFAGLRRVEAGPVTLLVEPGPGASEAEGADPGRAGSAGSAGSAGKARTARTAVSVGAAGGEPVGCGYLRPDAERLAERLAAAVAAMAPRLPIDPETRLSVAVERDHVEQIRHTGAVGEVTAGGGVAGSADLHLVYHPRDLFAYRQAVGRVLLDRSGLAGRLPPYLREGAALWLTDDAGGGGDSGGTLGDGRQPLDERKGRNAGLSATRGGGGAPGAGAITLGEASQPVAAGAWYGTPWRGWLLPLAAADVLPTVDELLAEEEPGDGSRLLWTPVAAALIDALPGNTLAAKLNGTDLRGPASTLLARLAAEGAKIRRHEAGASRDRGAASSALSALAEGFSATGDVEAASASVPARDPLPPFLAGVSLAMLNDLARGYQSPSVDRALVRLRETLHANSVSLMPFAYQPRADAPELRFLNRRPGSETDTAMIHAGRCADARGFGVLWKPQIWVSGGGWPGDVEMTSEADWQAWFRAYRRFLVHQAVLARWSGAEILSVGVELGRTVPHEADWRALIAAVRRVYDGPLTYAANWYGDFDRVPFWDALDLLGIDAYEPLSEDPHATPEELAAGAERVVAHLAAGAHEAGKPLLLTELGYAAHEGAWVAPHEEGGRFSQADQAAAYRAFLGALGRPPWLRGVFVWKAFSSAAEEGWDGRRGDARDHADFRFLGRPAGGVIGDYYAAH